MLFPGLCEADAPRTLAMLRHLKGREATPEEIAHLDELLGQMATREW